MLSMGWIHKPEESINVSEAKRWYMTVFQWRDIDKSTGIIKKLSPSEFLSLKEIYPSNLDDQYLATIVAAIDNQYISELSRV